MQSVLKIHYAATEELAAEHTASEAMTPRTRPLQCRLGFALLLLQTALRPLDLTLCRSYQGRKKMHLGYTAKATVVIVYLVCRC